MMTDSGGKKVVFRVAGVGFSLQVSALMEIRESSGVDIDRTVADPQRCLLGTIPYRDDAIDLVDIRSILGLSSSGRDSVLVVVLGTDGVWAFPAEKIEGVAPAAEFRSCDTPALLQGGRNLFMKIDIWRQEPLVCFNPVLVEQFRVPL